MSSKHTVQVNKTKSTDLEFQVKIDGVDDINEKVSVRFVIKTKANSRLSFEAKKSEGDSWKVHIPATDKILDGEKTYKVEVEVIVDNYYFVPASGELVVADQPTVTMNSIVVEEVEDDQLNVVEHASAGTAYSQPVPGEPQRPEKQVPTTHVEVEKEEPEDDKKKVKQISSSVIPGEGEDYVQDPFDAKSAAKSIVAKVMGMRTESKRVSPGKGKLFQRDAHNKPIVEGLESPEVKAELEKIAAEKEAKVKAALASLND